MIAPGNYAFYWPNFDILHAELATQFHQFLQKSHREGVTPKVRYAFIVCIISFPLFHE